MFDVSKFLVIVDKIRIKSYHGWRLTFYFLWRLYNRRCHRFPQYSTTDALYKSSCSCLPSLRLLPAWPLFITSVEIRYDFQFLTVFSTYLVTHWHPQAPAREYRVGATGRRLATRRARVGPTLWLAPALAGVRMARVMMAMLAKSLPVGPNIFLAVPSSSVQTHLPWRISDLFG